MTDEERDIITRFIQRVSGAQPGAPGGLPPVDPAADQLIGDLFTHYPDARYRLTQTAFVQEAAIKEVQARIRALETELQTTREALLAARAAPPAPAQRSSFFAGGFAAPPQQAAPQPPAMPPGNPWGQPAPAPGYGPQPPAYAAPQPQYAAQPAGVMQRGGSGFLGSALTTAAGVAGGVVAGNALMGLFSGHGGGMGGGFGAGGFGGGTQPVSETIINNYGDQSGFPPPDPGYTPWGEPPDRSGSQALNDGYWSKDSIYQPETASNDLADVQGPAPMPMPDFSDDSDLA